MSENRGSIRLLRVEKEIREVISMYLLGGFCAELPGLVTVTRVGCSKDLRCANVYVSVLGTEAEQDEALEILTEYASEVQHRLNTKLKMRYCPKVKFFLDHGFEKALKVERILHELSRTQTPSSVLT